MSDNVYLYNNRIMKMKDVDKELKKIGTWRDDEYLGIKIGVFAVAACLCLLGVAAFAVNHKIKEKQEFKQELQSDFTQNPTRTNSVYNAYINKALSNQY